ncbi:hypothetical protein H8D64_00005 [PVC group bacterium]|nr:hypothetical protein [PVC group bacterium]
MVALRTRSLRNRIIRAYWHKCRIELFALLALLLAGMLLSFFTVFLFDYFIGFPWPVRLILTLTNMAVFCVYLPKRNKSIIFARRQSLLHVARFIEKCAAEQKRNGFRSILVSAVEFSRKESFPGSKELQKRVINSAGKTEYDPSRLCLHNKAMVKHARRISLVTLTIYLLWAAAGTHSLITFSQRAFGLPAKYQTNTQIAELKYPRSSARYKDIEILLSARGEIPSRGEIRVKIKDEPPFTIPLEPTAASNTFRSVITRPTEHVAFTARIGDAKSNRKKIRIVPAPFIKSGKIIITPPKYTMMKPYQVELGDVELLENSVFEMTVQTDRKLESCILQAGRKAHRLERKNGEYRLNKKRIPSSRRYSVKLIDRYGIENENRLDYNMTVIEDQLPVVSISDPEDGSYYAPVSSLNWRIKASDDFLLSKGTLNCIISRRNEQGDLEKINSHTIDLDIGSQERDLVLNGSLSLLELGVEAGMQIEFKANVHDSNAFREFDEFGESATKTIHVVTPEELRAILEEQLIYLGKSIDDLKDDMEYQEDALGR